MSHPSTYAAPSIDEKPTYFSRFGGLWADQSNAPQLIDQKLADGVMTAAEAELFRTWVRQGYVVLKDAVPHDVIDLLLADCRRFWSGEDPRLRAVTEGSAQHVSPNPTLWATPGCRLLDVYFYSVAARRVMFAAPIARFLHLLFERDILAFQSLSFEQGSQQGMHQDTAYVVVSSPLEMAASWIALEDVQPGAGALRYYEGSHRLPEFCFSGEHKYWDPQRDGPAQHDQFARGLHTNAEAMGLPIREFQARKGDVLLWHADLAHGGCPITHANPKVSRRSLVTHYCPYNVAPNYFQAAPDHRARLRFAKGCYYSSWDYLAAEPLPSEQPTTPAHEAPRSLYPATPLSRARRVYQRIKPILRPVVPAFARTAGRTLIHALTRRG
jgi:phytanoyl-CoA hydroxylase